MNQDSTIQDYSYNLLQQEENYSPSLALIENENIYFSVRYIQSVFRESKQVAIAIPSLFFHPWYQRKIQAWIPQFTLGESQKVWSSRQLFPETDLILPNIEKLSILLEQGYQDGRSFHLTFLPVGRKLSQGSGLSFADNFPTNTTIRTVYQTPPRGPQGYSRGLIYGKYAYYYFAKGLDAYKKNYKHLALKEWNSALERVPYAYPALSNICRITQETDPRCSSDNLIQLQNISRGLF
jgi:hypothetical protein